MFLLQAIVQSGSTEPGAARFLFGGALPEGEQSSESAAVASKGRKFRLLARIRTDRAGAGLAQSASRLLEEEGPDEAKRDEAVGGGA